MTTMFHDSLPDVQSKTSTSWEQVASKTGALNARVNFLQLYAEYGGSNIDENVGIRVLVGPTGSEEERAFDYHTPRLAGQYKAFSAMGVIEPSVAGDYTIKLEVRALNAGQTVNVRRIRLVVTQE